MPLLYLFESHAFTFFENYTSIQFFIFWLCQVPAAGLRNFDLRVSLHHVGPFLVAVQGIFS